MSYRCVMIDPGARTVTEIELETLDFKHLYKLLDCEMIEQVTFYVSNRPVAFLCDEEGWIRGNSNRAIFGIEPLHPNPVIGKALICGILGENYTSSPVSAEKVQELVHWA